MPSIIITGISSGIGRAAALRFLREGWDVTGTVRSMPPTGSRESAALSLPAQVEVRLLDLAAPDSIEAFVAERLATSGPPDVLLNNAGMLHFGPVEEADPATMREVFQVNAFGQVTLAMGFVPAMRDRGSGLIVNVSSLGGTMVFPFFSIYNSSKHALEGLSEGMWHELKPFGIRVKVVRPGYVDTPIYAKAAVDRGSAEHAAPAYRAAMNKMVDFEARISRRTRPEEAAEELWVIVNDESDRFSYPIAAYARPLLAARRMLGETRFLRVAHRRWFGDD
jgi:NAD(P)-dependent dehydrogenase (short-subunit alcohol dehydrogenase family)